MCITSVPNNRKPFASLSFPPSFPPLIPSLSPSCSLASYIILASGSLIWPKRNKQRVFLKFDVCSLKKKKSQPPSPASQTPPPPTSSVPPPHRAPAANLHRVTGTWEGSERSARHWRGREMLSSHMRPSGFSSCRKPQAIGQQGWMACFALQVG